MYIFDELESNVRSYCRDFPEVFHTAKGTLLYTESGKEYVDFFSGAGALNYGHNNAFIKQQLMAYIESDGITHGLDMHTKAKMEFMEDFSEFILKPRGLHYKMQFCGSTGTNAVEAALKLARKVKNRSGIYAFMGSFHGMSLGSLAVTSSTESRRGAGVPLDNVTFVPYPYGFMKELDTIGYIQNILDDDHSGVEKPAAIIVETLQSEGGVIPAPLEWLKKLADLCKRNDILLICDDIQVGCGRTGKFFSFEHASIVPDIVILSKSISGYGLPMSMLLFKPEMDIWKPGEHNGTFRGNQLAFVAAKAALEYWREFTLERQVMENEAFIEEYLYSKIAPLSSQIQIRGRGMIWGIDFSNCEKEGVSNEIVAKCFQKGLIIERAGRKHNVIKLLPPLTTEIPLLKKGCDLLRNAIEEHLDSRTLVLLC